MLSSQIEYELLLKSEPILQTDLIYGHNYYIEVKYQNLNNNYSQTDYTVIYKGIFKEIANRFIGAEWVIRYSHFENIEIVFDPLNYSERLPCPLPILYDGENSGAIFRENYSPTKDNVNLKQINIEELKDFIANKKLEPHEDPSICFMGEDYRAARDRFKNN